MTYNTPVNSAGREELICKYIYIYIYSEKCGSRERTQTLFSPCFFFLFYFHSICSLYSLVIYRNDIKKSCSRTLSCYMLTEWNKNYSNFSSRRWEFRRNLDTTSYPCVSFDLNLVGCYKYLKFSHAIYTP